MRIIEYRIDSAMTFYDFNTIRYLLKIDRSKLQRDLKRISRSDYVKYKNQHLYNEIVLFRLMEEQLIKRFGKIQYE